MISYKINVKGALMQNKHYYPQEAYTQNNQQNNQISHNESKSIFNQPNNVSNLIEMLGDKSLMSKLGSNTSPQMSMLMGLLNQNSKKKSEQMKFEPTDYIKVSDYHLQHLDD